MRKVMIGLPCYGGVQPDFMLSLLDFLCSKPPFEVRVFALKNDSLVARARNRIAAAFLDSDCTHLLFLDTDLVFKPKGIHRLCSHDLPIVGGIYCQKRQDCILPVINSFVDGDKPDAETLLLKAKHVGTGLLCIAREVFVSLRDKMPEIAYKVDTDETDMRDGRVIRHDEAPVDKRKTMYDFFRTGVVYDEYPRYLSEDWYFCRLAREAGYPVYADFGVYADHTGTVSFPLAHLIKSDTQNDAQNPTSC